MRVVIYARISQDRDESSRAIDRQVADCQSYAARNGLTVVETTVDRDVSAFSGVARPGFERAMELIGLNQADGILAWKSDRLYRRVADLERVIDAFNAVDARVFTVDTGTVDLTTPNGRTQARIGAIFAMNEMELKGERTARAFKQLAEEGGWKGGRKPLGYAKDGVTLVPEEAKVIKEAASRLLSGQSLASVTAWASSQLGRELRATALREALLGPRVIGVRTYTSQRARTLWAERKRKGEVSGPCPPEATTKAEWDPILTPSTQEELRALFHQRKQVRGKSATEAVLARLLFCMECGHVLHRNPKSYYCPPPSQGGCGQVAISAAPTEQFIKDQVNVVLEQVQEQEVLGAEAQPQLPAQTEEWQQIDREREELKRLRDAGLYTVDETLDRLRGLDQRRERLSAEQMELLNRASQRRALYGRIGDWDQGTVQEQAQVLRLMIRHITIARATTRGRVFRTDRIKPIHWADGECNCEVERLPGHRIPRVHYRN